MITLLLCIISTYCPGSDDGRNAIVPHGVQEDMNMPESAAPAVECDHSDWDHVRAVVNTGGATRTVVGAAVVGAGRNDEDDEDAATVANVRYVSEKVIRREMKNAIAAFFDYPVENPDSGHFRTDDQDLVIRHWLRRENLKKVFFEAPEVLLQTTTHLPLMININSIICKILYPSSVAELEEYVKKYYTAQVHIDVKYCIATMIDWCTHTKRGRMAVDVALQTISQSNTEQADRLQLLCDAALTTRISSGILEKKPGKSYVLRITDRQRGIEHNEEIEVNEANQRLARENIDRIKRMISMLHNYAYIAESATNDAMGVNKSLMRGFNEKKLEIIVEDLRLRRAQWQVRDVKSFFLRIKSLVETAKEKITTLQKIAQEIEEENTQIHNEIQAIKEQTAQTLDSQAQVRDLKAQALDLKAQAQVLERQAQDLQAEAEVQAPDLQAQAEALEAQILDHINAAQTKSQDLQVQARVAQIIDKIRVLEAVQEQTRDQIRVLYEQAEAGDEQTRDQNRVLQEQAQAGDEQTRDQIRVLRLQALTGDDQIIDKIQAIQAKAQALQAQTKALEAQGEALKAQAEKALDQMYDLMLQSRFTREAILAQLKAMRVLELAVEVRKKYMMAMTDAMTAQAQIRSELEQVPTQAIRDRLQDILPKAVDIQTQAETEEKQALAVQLQVQAIQSQAQALQKQARTVQLKLYDCEDRKKNDQIQGQLRDMHAQAEKASDQIKAIQTHVRAAQVTERAEAVKAQIKTILEEAKIKARVQADEREARVQSDERAQAAEQARVQEAARLSLLLLEAQAAEQAHKVWMQAYEVWMQAYRAENALGTLKSQDIRDEFQYIRTRADAISVEAGGVIRGQVKTAQSLEQIQDLQAKVQDLQAQSQDLQAQVQALVFVVLKVTTRQIHLQATDTIIYALNVLGTSKSQAMRVDLHRIKTRAEALQKEVDVTSAEVLQREADIVQEQIRNAQSPKDISEIVSRDISESTAVRDLLTQVGDLERQAHVIQEQIRAEAKRQARAFYRVLYDDYYGQDAFDYICFFCMILSFYRVYYWFKDFDQNRDFITAYRYKNHDKIIKNLDLFAFLNALPHSLMITAMCFMIICNNETRSSRAFDKIDKTCSLSLLVFWIICYGTGIISSRFFRAAINRLRNEEKKASDNNKENTTVTENNNKENTTTTENISVVEYIKACNE